MTVAMIPTFLYVKKGSRAWWVRTPLGLVTVSWDGTVKGGETVIL